MNASATYELTHLQALEAESIHIIREVAAEFERPVLLFSGGKDSVIMLHLAAKAFAPARVPFPVMHIDTGHNFDEVLEFRDSTVERLGVRLVVASVEESIAKGRVRERPDGIRNPLQTVTLLDAILDGQFDAVFGGARRDEEKARAKERVFSFRDEFGQWDPKNQRPELWSLYNGHVLPGQNIRVFPLSNWTELDVWQYLAAENIELPSIYFAHQREVVQRGDMLYLVNEFTPLRDGETAERRTVRFRTIGDANLTAAVESDAGYGRWAAPGARTTIRSSPRACGLPWPPRRRRHRRAS
ncbi:MAG: sulfate adenylyltransferase subunit 2, partial [Frankiaceae bacterium]|nr:sulfate adenylyltransferase subunit 2 [Frankiaceae bacterium]